MIFVVSVTVCSLVPSTLTGCKRLLGSVLWLSYAVSERSQSRASGSPLVVIVVPSRPPPLSTSITTYGRAADFIETSEPIPHTAAASNQTNYPIYNTIQYKHSTLIPHTPAAAATLIRP